MDNPYTYYMLLRWVCCGTFLYLAVISHGEESRNSTWIFGLLAAIYNPFVPAQLTREVWSYLNLATVAVIVISFVNSLSVLGRKR
jgi:hypothetical protein